MCDQGLGAATYSPALAEVFLVKALPTYLLFLARFVFLACCRCCGEAFNKSSTTLTDVALVAPRDSRIGLRLGLCAVWELLAGVL